MSHTPKPWTVLWPKFDAVIVDAAERVIASVSFTDHVDVECEANSYLIASAPDLLAALKYVKRDLAQIIMGATNDVVEAAIAKAEGR